VKFIHVKFNRKLDTGQLKILNKLMNDVVADKSQLGERERERETHVSSTICIQCALEMVL
jgi:hypothetical protein